RCGASPRTPDRDSRGRRRLAGLGLGLLGFFGFGGLCLAGCGLSLPLRRLAFLLARLADPLGLGHFRPAFGARRRPLPAARPGAPTRRTGTFSVTFSWAWIS